MAQPSTPDKTFVDVNLKQWRRELQTFASTTQDALQAIVEELSNSCGSQAVSRQSQSSSRKSFSPRSATTANEKQEETQPDVLEERAFSRTVSDDRLAAIKKKLARRKLRSK